MPFDPNAYLENTKSAAPTSAAASVPRFDPNQFLAENPAPDSSKEFNRLVPETGLLNSDGLRPSAFPPPKPVDWGQLYGGVDAMDAKLTPEQKAAFSTLDANDPNPREGRSRFVNQLFVSHLTGVPQRTLMRTWPQAKRAFEKAYGLGPGTEDVNDTTLYKLIGDRLEAEQRFGMITKTPGLIGSSIDWVRYQSHLIGESGPFQPMLHLPDAPKNLPNVWWLGLDNPAILGGIYEKGFKPVVDGSSSLFGIVSMGLGGGLAEAAGKSALASGILRAGSGIFGGAMLYSAAKQTPEAWRTLWDPTKSLQEKSGAVAAPMASATMGLMGALGTVLDLHQAPEELAKSLQERTPAEMVDLLRTMADGESNPVRKGAMMSAADQIEEIAAQHPLKPAPAGAVYLGKRPTVLEGGPSVDQWQIDQTPENPRGRTVDRAQLEAEGIEAPPIPESEYEQELRYLKESAARSKARQSEDRARAASAPNQTIKQRISSMFTKISGMMDRRTAMRQYYLGQKFAAENAERLTASALKEADAASRADADAIKKDLLDIAAELPQRERGRYVSAIIDATSRPALTAGREGMYRRAMLVATRMMAKADDLERDGVVNEIKGMLSKAEDSKQVDVAYKRRIRDLVKHIALRNLTADHRGSLEATRDYVAAKGADHGVPDEVVHNLELLTQTPIHELPMNVLAEMRDRIRRLTEEGKLRTKTVRRLYDSEKASLTSDIQRGDAAPMQELPRKQAPGEEPTIGERVARSAGNKMRAAANLAINTERSVLGRDIVLDLLDGTADYNGPLNRIFGGRIDFDYGARDNLRRAWMAPIAEVLERNRFSKAEMERISIYAIDKEENGAARLLDSGVKPETIALVNRTISSKELEYYNAVRKVFDEQVYPVLAKTMRDLYNIDVKKVDNYWPFQRDHALVEEARPELKTPGKSGDEKGFDEMAAPRSLMEDFVDRPKTKTEQGMTIARLPEAHGAVRLNALEVVDRHIGQAAHLATYQRDLKMLGEIARADWFKQRYGNLGQKYVLDLLDTVARDGQVAPWQRWRMIDQLNRNSSVVVLGFRLLSQLKHLPNLAFAVREVRPDFLALGLRDALTPEGWNFVNQNFAEIANRWGGEFSISDIGGRTNFNKLQRGSFFLERALDSAIARATVLGRYYQELHAEGFRGDYLAEDPEAHLEAWRRALVISRKVVTSPLVKDIPQAVSRGTLLKGNVSLSHSLFQFQNTMLRQYAYMRHDIWDLGYRRAKLGQAMTGTLAFLAMLAGETTIIEANRNLMRSIAGQPEPAPDQRVPFAEDMATEALRRVPFAGNLMAFKYGDTGIPLESVIREGGVGAYQLATGKNQYAKPLRGQAKVKAEGAAATLGATVVGIPGVATAAQLYEKARRKRNTFSFRSQ